MDMALRETEAFRSVVRAASTTSLRYCFAFPCTDRVAAATGGWRSSPTCSARADRAALSLRQASTSCTMDGASPSLARRRG